MRRVKIRGFADVLYGELPYGWMLTPDRSTLVPHPDEQRVLALVRQLHAVEGVPMRAIVERLRAMGVVNRRGGNFGLSGVWEMVNRRRQRPPEARPSGTRRRPAMATGRKAAKRPVRKR